MKEETKNKLKHAAIVATPYAVAAGASVVATTLIYGHMMNKNHLAYTHYLEQKLSLFAGALDVTVETVAKSLQK